MHVSKGPSDKEVQQALKRATDQFARLGLIVNVLKGPGRERYDHFLHNGFPAWKGTGYYYSRFRPGLGTVLVGLLLAFGGAGHYAALIVSWKRQVEFVERYIRHARRTAWGDELGIRGITGVSAVEASASAQESSGSTSNNVADGGTAVNRRQKRMMDRENKKESKKAKKQRGSDGDGNGSAAPSPPPSGIATPAGGDRKRVVAENGKVLIVDSTGNVFLEEENEDGEKEEFLLDTSEISKPTIRDTMVFKIPGWLFGMTVGRVMGSKSDEVDVGVVDGDVDIVVDEPVSGSTRRRR